MCSLHCFLSRCRQRHVVVKRYEREGKGGRKGERKEGREGGREGGGKRKQR